MYVCPNCDGIQTDKPTSYHSKCFWCLEWIDARTTKVNRREVFAGGIDLDYTIGNLASKIRLQELHNTIREAEHNNRDVLTSSSAFSRTVLGSTFLFNNTYFYILMRHNVQNHEELIQFPTYRSTREQFRAAEITTHRALLDCKTPLMPTYVPILIRFIESLTDTEISIWIKRRWSNVDIPVKFKGMGPSLIKLSDVLFYWKRNGDLNFSKVYPGYLDNSTNGKSWSTKIYKHSPEQETIDMINERYERYTNANQ